MANVPRATIPAPNPGGGFGGIRIPTQAPLASFGGGEPAAEGFGAAAGLAQEAGKVFQQHLDDAVQAQTLDNVSQMSAKETELKLQLQQVKGKDALEAAKKASADFDSFKSKLLENSTNPLVQRSTAIHADQYKNSLNAWGQQYATGEFQNWDKATVRSTVENEQNAAIVDGSPQRIDQAIIRQKAVYQDYAKRAGWSPEELKMNSDAAVSATHFGVLQMIENSGNDLDAKAYYDVHKDEFVGNDAIRASRSVKTSSTIGEAARIVDSVFSRAVDFSQDKETGPIYSSEKDALDAVREATKDSSPLVREKAEEMTYRRYHVEKLAEKSAEDQTYEAMVLELRKTGDLETIQKSPAWEVMPEADKRQVEVTAARMAKGDSPYAKVSDPQVTAGFYGLNKDDVAKLSKADLMRLAPLVTEGKYNDMEKHWNAARQKEEDAAFKTTQSDDSHIFDSIKRSGVVDLNNVKSLYDLKKESNKKKSEAYDPIWQEVIDKYKEFFNNNNKNPNQEQKEQILKDIIIQKTLNKPQGFLNRIAPYVVGVPTGIVGTAAAYGFNYWRDQSKDIAVSPEDRARIGGQIARLGGDLSAEKVQKIRQAELAGASDELLRKLARE